MELHQKSLKVTSTIENIMLTLMVQNLETYLLKPEFHRDQSLARSSLTYISMIFLVPLIF